MTSPVRAPYSRISDPVRRGLRLEAAPLGTSLGALPEAAFLTELADALGLAPIGVYTPWATRVSDLEWESPERAPDTNTALWRLTDVALQAARDVTFGSPVPFVAILSQTPLTSTEADSLWSGTPYRAYETQAVYRQDDGKPIPTIFFLYWGERLDESEVPPHPRSLEQTAAIAEGVLVFGMQIPAGSSTTRDWPATPFATALEMHDLIESPARAAPAPVPVPVPVPAAPARSTSPAAASPRSGALALSSEPDWKPWAVGAAVAVGAFFVWRQVKKETA